MDWRIAPDEARRVQRELRERLVLAPPPGFAPRRVAGADISMERFGDTAFAGIVTIDAATMATLEEATAIAALGFPYVPGLLSFRELPAVAEAWARLESRPDVLVFDGQGYAHPRRFGIACHGGLLFGVPSIGCAKSILVGRHGELGTARGSTAPMVDRGEVVGMAVRLREGVKPVYVSAGHLMDLETAVAVVMSMAAGYREPETTRRAPQLVNRIRVQAKAEGALTTPPGPAPPPPA